MRPTSITIFDQYGILFICDADLYADTEMPPDVGAGPILSTETCITVWVIGDVDGPVRIELWDTDHSRQHQLEHRFSGQIRVMSGRIAVNTSLDEDLLGMDCQPGLVSVQIFSNHAERPSHVAVIFEQSEDIG